MDEQLIGTKRAAEILGKSQREVQHYCLTGQLPYQIVSNRYVMKPSDVEAFKAKLPKPGPKPGSKRKPKD